MRLALALCLTVATGCAASQPAVRTAPAPTTLAELNARFDTYPVLTLRRADGATVRGIRDVVVSDVDVRFVRDGQPLALPVEDVAEIIGVSGRATGRGAAYGAVPGLAVVGLAGASVLSGGADGPVGFVIVAVGAAGAGLAVLGSAAGALVGRRSASGERVRLYQAPVARYGVPRPPE